MVLDNAEAGIEIQEQEQELPSADTNEELLFLDEVEAIVVQVPEEGKDVQEVREVCLGGRANYFVGNILDSGEEDDETDKWPEGEILADAARRQDALDRAEEIAKSKRKHWAIEILMEKFWKRETCQRQSGQPEYHDYCPSRHIYTTSTVATTRVPAPPPPVHISASGGAIWCLNV